VPSFLSEADRRDTQARGRLTAAARQQLRVHGERLSGRAAAAGRRAPVALERSESLLAARATRVGALAGSVIERRVEEVRGWRRLLAAYDVDRQLERGYSLTLGPDGSLVRSAADVARGQEIVTRLADGTVRSTVEAADQTVEKVERGDVGAREQVGEVGVEA
jgi:exodeoxyribonuclease VII large subunit